VAALAVLLVVPAVAAAAKRPLANGPAVAVDLPGQGIVHPAAWMSLSGRPQSVPDRNTRGYFTSAGARVWLDVFPNVTVP
jgi:hypothetical protein